MKSRIYCLLPLRVISRAWGKFNSLKLPSFVKNPLMSKFISVFDLNMEEAQVSNYKKYPTMNSLFRRALKPDARPIDENSQFVSPCDGKVLSFGKLDENTPRI